MARIEPTKGCQFLAQQHAQLSERNPIAGFLWLVSAIGFFLIGVSAGSDVIALIGGMALVLLVFVLRRSIEASQVT